MHYKYNFTIFTPTYNRAHTLHRVFNSLQSQTERGFEWLIIDDGSTDQTRTLVQKWQDHADFPIRYIWQNNGGKHRAFNRGVREAQGELFLTLDSDDSCVPTSIERFRHHWESIDTQKKISFSAVTALCMDDHGRVVGDCFPRDVFDSNSIECGHKYHIKGEKWGFQKTDILKEFPFPEINGEKFITEAIVWNRIARKYQTRYINEKLRTYEVSMDSLSNTMTKLRAENPKGTTLYYNEYVACPISFVNKLKGSINYVRFSIHGKFKIMEVILNSNQKIMTVLLYLIGEWFYLKDISNDH